MAINLLPLGTLGAIENNGSVTFGLWLPWVSAIAGNAVTVKIIHERDQFLQDVPPREFPLTHSVRAPYGDFWSATVPIAGTPPATPGSAWGTTGRYVYRYRIDNPNVGSLDWIIDPCAREFGVGKLSAFTLGAFGHSCAFRSRCWYRINTWSSVPLYFAHRSANILLLLASYHHAPERFSRP
jgi:maltooligosyltrehalose trehalohydrolase